MSNPQGFNQYTRGGVSKANSALRKSGMSLGVAKSRITEFGGSIHTPKELAYARKLSAQNIKSIRNGYSATMGGLQDTLTKAKALTVVRNSAKAAGFKPVSTYSGGANYTAGILARQRRGGK